MQVNLLTEFLIHLPKGKHSNSQTFLEGIDVVQIRECLLQSSVEG